MIKKNKGFTLIELLAVIVILGLLMAIAIPSVTKYITQSRKKTITSTIGNYIGALVNDVNDLTYTFTETNTVYAVPIECIALERGGTDPFGHWLHANNSYWAYVLVQYDDTTSSYTYGYTFKDSAGYGLYPTSQSKLNEQGKQIQTGLDLTRPQTGKVTTITDVDNWSGFKVDESTELVVLVAAAEGSVGDGETTCTLKQKGDNYSSVEQGNSAGSGSNQTNENALANLIKKNNTIITAAPTLTTSSNNSSDASGLYKSTATNSGKETYYFRGNVVNNNVEFAGLKWKIIRINEDGTVRLIANSKISGFSFNTNNKLYYSESEAKPIVDNWYKINIADKGYDSYVANGTFCEQAKVKYSTIWTGGDATMDVYTAYTPDFKCTTDGNGKGVLNSKVGLITYDEVIHAGAYINKTNSNYYLYDDVSMWTMSPCGFEGGTEGTWIVKYAYVLEPRFSISNATFRPVINLNANVFASGTGTSDNPYVVQTS